MNHRETERPEGRGRALSFPFRGGSLVVQQESLIELFNPERSRQMEFRHKSDRVQ